MSKVTIGIRARGRAFGPTRSGAIGLVVASVAVSCVVSSTNTTKGSSSNGAGGSTTGAGGTTSVGSGQGGDTWMTTAGVGGAPTTCDPAAGDDQCTMCTKSSCCTEITACDQDPACATAYSAYRDCLFPGGGDWSGFSTNYCRQAASTSSSAADAMIQCFLSQCSSDTACGAEPIAAFSSPLKAGQDFSAADFMESFCSGCHFPGFVGPSGQTLTNFTDDANWSGIKANPSWFSMMDYNTIVGRKEALWCGIHPDVLPDGCSTLDSPPIITAGFFSKPQKFPPSGMGTDSQGNLNPCTFASDGMTCPQPTHFQRARMVSWLLEDPPPQ